MSPFSHSPIPRTPRFMGRGVIELPIEEVTFYLRNITHREQWDKHLVVGGALNNY